MLKKNKEWEARQSERAEEVEAISMAISILNEDDALDLFKKTLKTPETPAVEEKAFLQVRATKGSKLSQVRAMLSTQKITNAPAVALLQNTLVSQIKAMQKSGKVDFSKVTKMIDDMVSLLKKEQSDDESSKKYCEKEFDSSDDEKKALTATVKSLSSSIAQMKDEIAALKSDLAALADKMAALDKTVAEATEQRKEENAEFTATSTANNMAKDLIGKAKNRLNKFYNPEMYVRSEEEMPEKSFGEKLAAGELTGFIQLRMTQQQPEVEFAGRKNQKNNSVMALMDKLIREIEIDTQSAESEEKEAQKDYEELLSEAQKTRADDVKTSADKSSAKADLEESLEETKRSHSLKTEALADNAAYIADLHKQCDFIVATFEERRSARSAEISGLGKAKAVLSGADYSMF